MKIVSNSEVYKYYLYKCGCGARNISKTKDAPLRNVRCNNCLGPVPLTKEIIEKESHIKSKF